MIHALPAGDCVPNPTATPPVVCHPHPGWGHPGWGLGGPLGFGGLGGYYGGYGGFAYPYASQYGWNGLGYFAPQGVQVLPAITGIPVQVISGVSYQSLGGVLVQVVG